MPVDDSQTREWNRRDYLKVGPAALMLGAAGCLGDGGDGDGGDGDGGDGDGDGGDGDGGDGDGGDGGGSDWESQVDSIEFLTWQLDFLEESANGWKEDFESEYDVEAEWIDRPAEEFIGWFQSRIQSGDPPAAVNTPYVWYFQYAQDDVYADVEAYASDDMMSTFEDRFGADVLEELKVDGTLAGIPWYDATRTMFYNASLFEDAGLELELTNDWSFQEFMDNMERALEETDAEYGWTATTEEQYPWFLPFFAGWDPQIQFLSDDLSEPAFDTDATVELVSEIARQTEEGVVPDLTWTERKQPQAATFAGGDTLSFLSDGSILRIVDNEGDWVDEESMGITSWPQNPHEVDPMMWSPTAQRSDPEITAAVHFMDVVTNLKWSKDFLRNTTVLVNNADANQELANDEAFVEENPLLARLYEQYFAVGGEGNVYTPPQHPDIGEISDAVGSELTSGFLGEKDPEQAVSDAASRAEQLL